MSRSVTLALAALALTAVSGCDDLVQRAAATHGGPSTLKEDADALEGKGGDCGACAKFRARPPAGINIPPSL